MLNILVYFLLIQVYFSLKKTKEILSQTKKAYLKWNTKMCFQEFVNFKIKCLILYSFKIQ